MIRRTIVFSLMLLCFLIVCNALLVFFHVVGCKSPTDSNEPKKPASKPEQPQERKPDATQTPPRSQGRNPRESERSESQYKGELNRELQLLQAQQEQINSLKSALDSREQQVQAAAQASSQQAAQQAQLQAELQSQQEAVAAILAERAPAIAEDNSEVLQKEVPGRPVYNAVFSPTVNSEPASLIDGKKTSLRFFIGPNDYKNAIVGLSAEVVPSLRRTLKDIPLTVTMVCSFCRGHQTDLMKIIYHGSTQTSSEAQFRLLPDLALAQGLGTSTIILDVRNSDTAVRYNRLSVGVTVQNAHAISAKGKSIAIDQGSFSSEVEDKRRFRPDAIITLLTDPGKPFDLKFEAISRELREQTQGLELSKKQVGGARQAETFHTHNLTTQELEADQDDVHLVLKGLMDQQNTALLEQIKAFPGRDISVTTSDYVTLSQEDHDKVLRVLDGLGDALYTRIFLSTGSTFIKLIKKLEAFTPADRHPVRILIKTSSQAVPWQLLHIPGSSADSGFWGFKFELAVEDMARLGPAVVQPMVDSRKPRASLVGTYGGDNDYPVQYYGETQAAYLQKVMPSGQFAPAKSVQAFQDALRAKRNDLDFILLYTHGSDGWALTQTPDQGQIRSQLVPRGPRVIFDQTVLGASITASQIVNIPVGFDSSKAPFLNRNPIVLINACESGILATNDLTLPNAFTELGARAVIATEAPISHKFGFVFGNDLIDEFANGSEMAAGLLRVRKKYLEKGNPLGLVYAYYIDDGNAKPEDVDRQATSSERKVKENP
jgi:hypothetical protein